MSESTQRLYSTPSLRELAPSVTIDVSIRGGNPCVKGTALPTSKVWEAFANRRSIRAIAKDHRISEAAVEDVLRYELETRAGRFFRLGELENETAFRQIDEMLDDWRRSEGMKPLRPWSSLATA